MVGCRPRLIYLSAGGLFYMWLGRRGLDLYRSPTSLAADGLAFYAAAHLTNRHVIYAETQTRRTGRGLLPVPRAWLVGRASPARSPAGTGRCAPARSAGSLFWPGLGVRASSIQCGGSRQFVLCSVVVWRDPAARGYAA
jgi:hypothetical protein